VTSASFRRLVPAVMHSRPGFPSVSHFALGAQPVHSLGSLPLPRPRFARNDALRCRTHHLLAIAYDYDVLGLGPDSPWDDCRCPGTLRLPVSVVRTRMTLLIPAFALVQAPPVFSVELLCLHNAPLPTHLLMGSTASVCCLSLATLSVHAHSTSELLRTLPMMAASKPTSWLSLRTHPLEH
jgi:hypothetical protein